MSTTFNKNEDHQLGHSMSALAILEEAQKAEQLGDFQRAASFYEDYMRERPMASAIYRKHLKRLNAKLKNVKHPIISIIVPCHNSALYLSECLESIRVQTFTDFEVLVVDDASSDESYDIACSFSENDNRFKVIKLTKPTGSAGVPRNIALNQAVGDFIGFVDSDDWIGHDYYELMIATATRTNADVVITSGFTDVKSDDNRVIRKYSESEETLQRLPLKVHKSSMIWDKIYKKDLLIDNHIQLGEGPAAVDVIFNFKVYFYMKNMEICDSIGYFYRRETTGSVTVRFRKKTKCEFEIEAYNSSLKWAKEENVNKEYIGYIRIKQLTSFLYTCRIISITYLRDYFVKCCKIIRSHDKPDFIQSLRQFKSSYLLKDYEIFLSQDLRAFISIYRTEENWITLSAPAKNTLPKSIICPADSSLKDQYRSVLAFFPDWTVSNPYQKLLYERISNDFNLFCLGYDTNDLTVGNIKRLQGKLRFIHLHWTHPYTATSKTFDLAMDSFAFAREACKAKILWTVHNKLPHNCENPTLELSCRKALAAYVDIIIVHSLHAKRMAVALYDADPDKVKIVRHGLYEPSLEHPKKLENFIAPFRQSRSVVVSLLGDLKPYKNTQFFYEVVKNFNNLSAHFDIAIQLVIAGKPYTPDEDKFFLAESIKYSWLYYHNKRLTDSELSSLVHSSDFVAIPYNTLTSGMAVNVISHKKLIIAPFSDFNAEYFGQTGSVFYSNTDDLMDKLLAICQHKKQKSNLEGFYSDDFSSVYDSLKWESITQRSATKQVFAITDG